MDANALKKEKYAELAEKIKAVKDGLTSSLIEIREFAKAHELILLPEELNYYGDNESIVYYVAQLNVPTDQQIEDNWSFSNIQCGYKPAPEDEYPYTMPESWFGSDCAIEND